jgi:hypothetical protein
VHSSTAENSNTQYVVVAVVLYTYYCSWFLTVTDRISMCQKRMYQCDTQQQNNNIIIGQHYFYMEKSTRSAQQILSLTNHQFLMMLFPTKLFV